MPAATAKASARSSRHSNGDRRFTAADLGYLANLCHGCGSCYYACQYAPPHEFALNFPKLMEDIRAESYRKYAWPGALARLFERNGLVVSLATAACMVLLLVAMVLAVDTTVLLSAHPDGEGSFYAVIPHRVMAYGFGAVFVVALFALFIGGGAVLARYGRGRARVRESRAVRPVDERRAATQVPGGRRRRLHLSRRSSVVRAPVVSSRDVLRVHALFRGDLRCDRLSLCSGLAGALPVLERAGSRSGPSAASGC